MRASLMDELGKQYVVTARAKGVAENHLLFRYPVRVAVNPIISTVGWILPEIVSGSTITALVLSLPTIGPALYSALLVEDMFLAGAIILLLGSLTIIGTIISDFLLVVVDPRIRFDQSGRRHEAASVARAGSIHDREHYYLASGWQLMWRKFRRHRLAIGGGTVLALLFTMSIFAEFFTPYSVERRFANFHPPSRIRLTADSGRFPVRPFVYGITSQRDPETFAKVYAEDRGVRYPIRLFAAGEPYRLLGLIPARVHLFGVDEPGGVFLFGTDVYRPGRLLAHPVRGSRVAADRLGRRVSDLRHRRYAGRHIGLLRRPCRHADPARDRVSHVDTHDSAVARPQRGRCPGTGRYCRSTSASW